MYDEFVEEIEPNSRENAKSIGSLLYSVDPSAMRVVGGLSARRWSLSASSRVCSNGLMRSRCGHNTDILKKR
jgi:hypothetical protein